MKKRLIVLILLLLPFLLLTSCRKITTINGEGSVTTKEIILKKDSSLTIEDILVTKENKMLPVEIQILSGAQPKMEIISQENILDRITIDESVGILTISGYEDELYSTDSVKINIYGCDFSSMIFNLCNVTLNTCSQNVTINLKKASTLHFENLAVKTFSCTLDSSSIIDGKTIQGKEFSAVLNSNAKLDIESIQVEDVSFQGDSSIIKVKELETINAKVNLTSSSKMDCKGNGKHIDVTTTTSSIYDGKELIMDSVTLIAMSDSIVDIYAKKTINVINSGAKRIEYYGDAIITKTSFGNRSNIW